MSSVAKKTSAKPEEQPEPDPVPNPVLGFRVTPRLHADIKRVAGKERRKIAQLLFLLVEEAMVARGEHTPDAKPGG